MTSGRSTCRLYTHEARTSMRAVSAGATACRIACSSSSVYERSAVRPSVRLIVGPQQRRAAGLLLSAPPTRYRSTAPASSSNGAAATNTGCSATHVDEAALPTCLLCSPVVNFRAGQILIAMKLKTALSNQYRQIACYRSIPVIFILLCSDSLYVYCMSSYLGA